ncbi:hypothetical protein BpHYR1_052960 [Brachionus plicatilis]|uniref:Uncharacterized protein n=1 Tax=Brachionus plicatilis TaxID=10195 RepID=A0A3M7PYI5_BRAPC|nr:hypothetical protein BpHYR1_052960 [Brachionus plicatilis]
MPGPYSHIDFATRSGHLLRNKKTIQISICISNHVILLERIDPNSHGMLSSFFESNLVLES